MEFQSRTLHVAAIIVLRYLSECYHRNTIIPSTHIFLLIIGMNRLSYEHLLYRSGAVFGWGKNTFGQLGVGDENPRYYPQQLKTLRSIGVRKVFAGEDFSIFLTSDGGVFSCGAGNFGQLGHGNRANVSLPRMVVEMMGTEVSQVTCGNRHSLTYVPSRGRVFAFGLNSCGQLGRCSFLFMNENRID